MELKNFKYINKGCLIASFTLCTDVYDKNGNKKGEQKAECAYFEKGSSYWVNTCAKTFEARDGTKKSYNMLTWDSELTKILARAIREKIKNKDFILKEQPPPEPDENAVLPF
jgi:hypothetical protein